MSDEQTAIVKSDDSAAVNIRLTDKGFVPQDGASLMFLAKVAMQSGLAPAQYKTPMQVFIVMAKGAELGISPLSSLSCFAPINNTPTLLVKAAKAIAMRAYPKAQFEEKWDGDTSTHIVRVRRSPDDSWHVSEFSWGDAETAGLAGNHNYKKYPKRMLRARAMGHALSDVFSDALMGMEVEGTIDETDVFAGRSATPALLTSGDSDGNFRSGFSEPAKPAPKVEPKPEPVAEKPKPPEPEQKPKKPAPPPEPEPEVIEPEVEDEPPFEEEEADGEDLF